MSSPAPSVPVVNNAQVVDVNSINRMSGPEFEVLVARLFEKMGFQVEMTKASHDGGIDLIAHCHVPLMQGRYIIQCKRYDGSVGVSFVRDLFGVMTAEHANKGILVTNSTFSASAEEFARGKPLELIDGDKLLQLLARNQLASVTQVKHCITNDQEIARLKQLVGAFPNELRWRVELVQYVLGIVECPFGISTRDDLIPYVEEAEMQLSVINDMSLKSDCCGFVNLGFSKSIGFSFLDYSSSLCLGRLQLCQRRAVEAVKWMTEPLTRLFTNFWCYPNAFDVIVVPNIVNIANIAALCGRPAIREHLFSVFVQNIRRFVQVRKIEFREMVTFHEKNASLIQQLLNGLKRVENIFNDTNLLFGRLGIVRDFPAMLREPHELSITELSSLMIDMTSISEAIAPTNGIPLSDSSILLSNQGVEVEQALIPFLACIEKQQKTVPSESLSGSPSYPWQWMGTWQKRGRSK